MLATMFSGRYNLDKDVNDRFLLTTMANIFSHLELHMKSSTVSHTQVLKLDCIDVNIMNDIDITSQSAIPLVIFGLSKTVGQKCLSSAA